MAVPDQQSARTPKREGKVPGECLFERFRVQLGCPVYLVADPKTKLVAVGGT